jgi:hypothetical protein
LKEIEPAELDDASDRLDPRGGELSIVGAE